MRDADRPDNPSRHGTAALPKAPAQSATCAPQDTPPSTRNGRQDPVGGASSNPAPDPELPQRIARALARRPREVRDLTAGFRRAAVLVLLTPDPEGWSLPLMLRTEAGGPHSGQISFPGGRSEESDEDAQATALREASEEFGLDRNQVRILGLLDDETTPTGYLVTPVVGWIDQTEFSPDPDEVAEIFSVPLSFFSDPKNEIRHEPVRYEGRIYTLYEYRYEGKVIWGLTARIIHKLVETVGVVEDSRDRPSGSLPAPSKTTTAQGGARSTEADPNVRGTRRREFFTPEMNEEPMTEKNGNETTLHEYDRIQEAADAVRAALGPDFKKPEVGMILGSGLGAFAERLEDRREIPYEKIPHFPTSAVAGHAGKLVLGNMAGIPLVVMQGRVHYYEGHDLTDVVRPARVLVTLGAQTLIVTNAAGSARKDLAPGELVLIRDHLNMLGHNPLRGPNDERLGPRFPDMSQAYDPKLRSLAAQVAQAQGWQARQGVYACMMGPSYETPAEVAMVGRLGADLVGMSTVPEVIAARHMGARILGISCVTNYGSGLSDKPLSHEEVKETAARVTEKFEALLTGVIESLAAQATPSARGNRS